MTPGVPVKDVPRGAGRDPSGARERARPAFACPRLTQPPARFRGARGPAPGPAPAPRPRQRARPGGREAERAGRTHCAAANASYTFLGMRPRAGTSSRFDCAHARTAAGSGATAVWR